MGLFSGIISAVGGSLIKGIFAKKAAKKERANALADGYEQFARLRDAAEHGGFNPLTALQSTGTAGFGNLPSGVAPLMSTEVLTGAIQGVADELTGKNEADRARQKVEDEFNQIQLERLKAGGAQQTVQRSANKRTTGGARVPGVATTPAKPDASDPFDIMQIEKAKPGMKPVEVIDVPKEATVQHVGPVYQSFTNKDGDVVKIPVGPDLDEVLTGVALEKGPAIVDKFNELHTIFSVGKELLWGFPSVNGKPEILKKPRTIKTPHGRPGGTFVPTLGLPSKHRT